MAKKISKVRIYVDILFFTLMLLVLVPQSTGIAIHEWASFIIFIPFLIHLTINWHWIAANSRKFLKRETNKTRFDYVLNWLLYLLMIFVMVSGIVISESVLPLFGIHFQPNRFWSVTHDVSATLLMAVLGIHIALHWKWIVGNLRKLKFKSDLHHLAGIKVVISKYAGQLILIFCLSVVFSVAFWTLEYSDWAEGFRQHVHTHDGEKSKEFLQSWLIYILPLTKVAIITAIPALLTGGIIRLKRLVFLSKLLKTTGWVGDL